MSETFYNQSKELREALRKRIMEIAAGIPQPKLRDIVIQRSRTSSFLKGTMAYHIHDGVGGSYEHEEKLELASSIEIFCSAGALLDNVIDGHETRNGETTYLKEYGVWMQLAASQYVLHDGLRRLLPFLPELARDHPNLYRGHEAVLGMVGMDIERPDTFDGHIKVLRQSNGIFNEIPLIIAASTGTSDKTRIKKAGEYGFNLGVGLAIYEEIRDLVGQHGRPRATEVESGRFVTPLHLAKSLDNNFDPTLYLGRKLSDEDYTELMKKVVQSGSFDNTVNLVGVYFGHCRLDLRRVVDEDCFAKLDPLTESVDVELNKIRKEATEKYGK